MQQGDRPDADLAEQQLDHKCISEITDSWKNREIGENPGEKQPSDS